MSVIIFSKKGRGPVKWLPNFKVPPNISATGKAINVEVVNKTANIKSKIWQSVRSINSAS